MVLPYLQLPWKLKVFFVEQEASWSLISVCKVLSVPWAIPGPAILQIMQMLDKSLHFLHFFQIHLNFSRNVAACKQNWSNPVFQSRLCRAIPSYHKDSNPLMPQQIHPESSRTIHFCYHSEIISWTNCPFATWSVPPVSLFSHAIHL